jgi:hypothetical protein
MYLYCNGLVETEAHVLVLRALAKELRIKKYDAVVTDVPNKILDKHPEALIYVDKPSQVLRALI